MSEFWDIYNADGTFSGKTMEARDEVPKDAWIMLVHFFIFDRQGRVLLQKRSMKKRWFPGIWDGTGGRAQAGESPKIAAARELFEELGLRAKPEDFIPTGMLKTDWRNFIHIFGVRLDFTAEDCVLQEDEVDEVRLMSREEAREKFVPKNDPEYLTAYDRTVEIFFGGKSMKLDEINIRDPFIMADDGVYYMYGTRGADTWGIGTGFDVYSSRDLENWSGPFEIFRKTEDFWATHNFWAPECHKYRGAYYLFASFKADGRDRGTQILRSNSPYGPFEPWSDGPVTPKGWECLDGTLAFDGDKPYIVFSHEWTQIENGTICARPLKEDLSGPDGDAIELFNAKDCGWAKSIGEKGTEYVTDGPELYRTDDGRLVMFWSSIADCYYEGAAVSESGSVTGPWRQIGTVYEKDGGHGMPFRTFDGRQLFVLHSPNETPLERPVFFTLRENGEGFYLE